MSLRLKMNNLDCDKQQNKIFLRLIIIFLKVSKNEFQ